MEHPNIRDLFTDMLSRRDGDIELDTASLLIAKEEYPELNVGDYLDRLDSMADEIKSRLSADYNPTEVVETINEYLFINQGFSGNQQSYYDPKNSYLSDVLDRKTGIPITLSIIYMEIGRRLGFKLQGLGMPGHFILGYRLEDELKLLDPYNAGAPVTVEQCQERVKTMTNGGPFRSEFLRPMEKRQIIWRMLNNLKGIYVRASDFKKAVSIVDRMMLITPKSPVLMRDRGVMKYRMETLTGATEDLEHYLKLSPNAWDTTEVKQLISVIWERRMGLDSRAS
ncbi:MAG: tetratricopeptide repeat protein [Dehalococcoidia bacterium]|nr:tetratricopeptide repeat protein [Dehalococcoidia bacterium]